MRRSPRSPLALGLLLGALAVGLFLLFDPLGSPRESPATAVPDELPRTPPEEPAAELPEAPQDPTPATAPEPELGNRTALAPEPGAARAVLRVLDEAGRPASGARVLLARGEQLLLDGPTDAQGRVEHLADGDPVLAIVVLERRYPELREIRLTEGTQDWRAAAGARIDGQLVREDGASAAGLRLRLDFDRPPALIASMPEIVQGALRITPQGRAYLESEAEGAFELSGLASDWSGRLLLPSGFRVLSTTWGELLPGSRGLRLARPEVGLVIHVAPESVLRGRLVLRDGGGPLAGASLSASQTSPEVPPQFSGLSTDDEGRFELRRLHERLSSFDLRLGGRFHESPSILRLEGSAVPADGELGDVLVDDVRDIAFELRDPGGDPIAGGVALAAGVRSRSTDRGGRSVLRWIPRSVGRLRAEADGFLPALVDLTPVLPDPLVVELQPANSVSVHLVPPLGGDPRQFKVVLLHAEGVTAVPVSSTSEQRAHVNEWAFAPYDLSSAPPGTFLCAKPAEADGVALFRGLRSGVEIELEVRGITGANAFHQRTLAPLGAAEERFVEVQLGEGLTVLRGRVLDQEGRGLSRATVQFGNQIVCWTEDDGSFLGFLEDPGPRTLLLQHEACSTLFLHDYVAPVDGSEVEFRLSPARRVTIEVVDEAGRPVPQAEVWIRQEGFITNTHRVDQQRHLASSLTDEPFEIEVRLAGRRYSQEHTADRPTARVVVPVHGRVVARLSGATTAGRAGRFQLLLLPAEGEPGDALVAGRPGAPELRLELPAVHPGAYLATLSYEPTEEELAAGLEPLSGDPRSITVDADRETEIRLELPPGR